MTRQAIRGSDPPSRAAVQTARPGSSEQLVVAHGIEDVEDRRRVGRACGPGNALPELEPDQGQP